MQANNPQSTIGPDINEFSKDVNFQTLSNNSDFIYLRSSASGTGTFRIDQKFIQYAKECRNVGLPCGAYHFALPSSDMSTATSQCDNFIQTLYKGFGNGDCGDLFPVLDVETPSVNQIDVADLVSWIQTFKDRFFQKTRRRIMLYTSAYYIQTFNGFNVPGKGYPLSKMPLWMAYYLDENPAPTPPNVGGWTKWTMWQFTDSANHAGVNNPVDLSYGPNNVDVLMPPPEVQNFSCYKSAGSIKMTWSPVNVSDLGGYNLFVNSYYAGTVPPKATSFSVSCSKFYMPKGKAVVTSIEAFDHTGDVSKKRATCTLKN